MFIFNLYVIRQRTVRQKVLHRITAGIPGVQSTIHSPKHAIFVCLCCSQCRNKLEGLQRAVLTVVMLIPDTHNECVGHKCWNVSRLQSPHRYPYTGLGTPLLQSSALTLPYGISNPSAQFANGSQVGFPLVLESRNVM